ncbi:hypothetical protein SAMN04488696_0388 [Methanolobus profundi]|uniref:Uncharacterized protein n=1 Tax=Methanolobus profundi TaxID=487685 RepID=A0A1I4P125_9EURY|nr:hypothetical protein SAMN04488696_0388 [Methanolobus profundi]
MLSEAAFMWILGNLTGYEDVVDTIVEDIADGISERNFV